MSAPGCRLMVVDPGELDGGLVRDVTEVLASLWARLSGRRAAGVAGGLGGDAA